MNTIDYLHPDDFHGQFETDLIAFRHHLHRHPELSFQEFETTQLGSLTLTRFENTLEALKRLIFFVKFQK